MFMVSFHQQNTPPLQQKDIFGNSPPAIALILYQGMWHFVHVPTISIKISGHFVFRESCLSVE